MLGPRPGETLLDIGCGTGYFTRRFAREAGVRATGLDPDERWLAYARPRAPAGTTYLTGVAETLPFPDRSFDRTVSVTALCFVPDERRAVTEMLRVTRKRFALGLLNRNSLLYRQKAGRGAYAGTRWHIAQELRDLLKGLPVRDLELKSAVFLPDANVFSRVLETLTPNGWLRGALLVAAGNVA